MPPDHHLESNAAALRAAQAQAAALKVENQRLRQELTSLREAKAAKSQFLAMVSHELRTPLNAVIGFSRILLRKVRGRLTDQQFRNLELIHSSGKQLLCLVNDVLDFERIESGRLTVSTGLIDCQHLARSLGETMGPAADERGVELEVSVPRSSVTLTADRDRLRQVLTNLINNALKHSEADHIQVEFAPEPDGLRISVCDDGVGIPADALERIFEPFYQVGSEEPRDGAGLGLAIVKKLVELMGGSLKVESSPGTGTRFSVLFPNSRVGQDEPAQSSPAGGDGQVLLLIDDEPHALEILVAELSEGPFRIHTATSGEEGLRKARELTPDVIVLDILMPGLDGWQVLRELRSDPSTCSIPVVISSILDDVPAGLNMGVAAWLSKPIDLDEFRTTLTTLPVERRQDILVVDDDPGVRSLLRQELEDVDSSVKVRLAGDGTAALEALSAGFPQLIIMDLMLPGLSGLELLEEIRANPEARSIPVIVYTGKDLSDHEHQILAPVLVVEKGDERGLRRLVEAAGAPREKC